MAIRKELLSPKNAEKIQRENDRERNRPHVLLSDRLCRHESARRLIFLGLERHYIECVLSGRLEAWKQAAHAAADLLSCTSDIEFVRRTETP